MSYFEREAGGARFVPTKHVGGAWNTQEQHIAPALGLLAHCVELDRDVRRGHDLVIGRLAYDILGTIPLDIMDIDVRVVRTGRTIELVEATLGHGGRDALILRAWLMQPGDTATLAATSFDRIPGPDDTPVWDPTTVWPGGFIESAQVRRTQAEPGRAAFWVRTDVPLVAGETVSTLASAVGLLDIANGMTTRVSPLDVAFPNLDTTVHFFTEPRGDWVGFDTSVSFGSAGIGLTHSVIHDIDGPVGVVAQILTIRPKR